jgi:hypothetical protein
VPRAYRAALVEKPDFELFEVTAKTCVPEDGFVSLLKSSKAAGARASSAKVTYNFNLSDNKWEVQVNPEPTGDQGLPSVSVVRKSEHMSNIKEEDLADPPT